jgi:hypothetical protein
MTHQRPLNTVTVNDIFVFIFHICRRCIWRMLYCFTYNQHAEKHPPRKLFSLTELPQQILLSQRNRIFWGDTKLSEMCNIPFKLSSPSALLMKLYIRNIHTQIVKLFWNVFNLFKWSSDVLFPITYTILCSRTCVA